MDATSRDNIEFLMAFYMSRNKKRDIEIFLEHEKFKKPYSELGLKHSLSGCRVRDICLSVKRFLLNKDAPEPDPFLSLRPATARVLLRAGFKTKSDVPESFGELLKLRGCGIKAAREIMAFLKGYHDVNPEIMKLEIRRDKMYERARSLEHEIENLRQLQQRQLPPPMQ